MAERPICPALIVECVQALNSYKTYGLDTDASPDNRNTGNNLSPTVKDGTSLTLLVSYPTTGPSPNM